MALIFTPQGNTTANYVDGSYDSIYVRIHKTAFCTQTATGNITATVSYTDLTSISTTTFAVMTDTAGADTAEATQIFCNIGDQEAGALTCSPTPNKITKQDGNEVTLSTKYELKTTPLQMTAADEEIYNIINSAGAVDILVKAGGYFHVYPNIVLSYDQTDTFDPTTVLKAGLTGSRTIGRNDSGWQARPRWMAPNPA